MPRKQERIRTKSARPDRFFPVSLDRKEAILAKAKQDILAGKTIDQIAAEHGIAHATLELWLSALGDEYIQLRKAWLDGMLIEAGNLLKDASDPLGLARARELFRRACWYAERRDRARYGQDQVQVAVVAPVLNITIRSDGATNAVQHADSGNAALIENAQVIDQ